MTFPARFQVLAAESGTFNGESAGAVHATAAISTANVAAGTLSCLFTVTAATASITITGTWQVSDDNSTWYTVGPSNNAAAVVLATGTASALSKVLVAPSEVQGWKYVRAAVTSGAQTGGASDLYSMQIRFRRFNGFS